IYSHISKDRDQVDISYSSQLNDQEFAVALNNSFQKDLALQYSTQGIHKDDILLMIGDKAVKKYGSQGQQKTFVIALKLAQFDFILAAKGIKPILLLDDIFDKLDDSRVKYLLELVAGDKFGQLFVTHTHKERLLEMFKGVSKDLKHHEINYPDLVKS
ncbi:MAG: DNA replication and repair protein RecF, partial [Bacteroidia bacterium]|nr:DNA replication and repair protein RecF [Bacteroidia bacterium]